MKFSVIDGALRMEAESRADVREIISHYKLDPFNFTDAYTDGELVFFAPVTRKGRHDECKWFACEYNTGPTFLAPYMERLAKVTGYTGPVPSIDVKPYNSIGDKVLCHTHTVTRARIDPTGYTATGFIQSQDWDDRTAEVRAPHTFAEYVKKDIGDVKIEPEYIGIGSGGGGLLRRNPNYLKHHAPHAAAKNSNLFGALLDWWLANEATAWQHETFAAAVALHKGVCKTDTAGEWLLREYQGIRLSWGGPLITFEQFAKGEPGIEGESK